MADSDPSAVAPAKAGSRRGILAAYWRLAGGFWRGESGPRAWTLTVFSAVLIVVNIAVQYGINQWNRYFFNALDQKNSTIVFQAMVLFSTRRTAPSSSRPWCC